MGFSHPGAILCCEVNVEPPNPGSLRFHQRIGFAEVDKIAPKPGYIVSLLVKTP
jgi:predicted GNAT superfamily acetyltransferase